MAIGLRPRFDPPLEDAFLGSPLVNFSSSLTTTKLIDGSVGDTASLSENSQDGQQRYSPRATTPLRIRVGPHTRVECILGKSSHNGHFVVGTGSWDIDFGCGMAVDVISGTFAMGGLMMLMDEKRKDVVGDEPRQAGRWYEDGVRVRLCLLADVMERVLADPRLRPQRHKNSRCGEAGMNTWRAPNALTKHTETPWPRCLASEKSLRSHLTCPHAAHSAMRRPNIRKTT